VTRISRAAAVRSYHDRVIPASDARVDMTRLAGGERAVITWGREFELWWFSLGLACCAVEVVAAADHARRAGDAPAPLVGSADRAHVLVIAGTLTDRLAPALPVLYDAMPEPRRVVSFGSCATCGGPYWDSHVVTKGADQLVPVDVYVPGCPPRPEALLDGLLTLHEGLSA
jgi:NADH-quinone oxidoreductase subunit B